MKYETVCGLEVHAELSTKTKVFCSCTTAFGGEPNTHCCPVCLGLPGSLPVLNERVVEYALRCGLALHSEITRRSCFDRKNYFYPDLPKAYQISQLYLPICRGGYVTVHDTVHGGMKRVHLHEIHIEEDAGKLVHQHGKTLVNYNRAGVPLLEIVSEPELANGEEAAEYTERLKEILQFCGISDCKMQEGSLRADVNVSVREVGSTVFGTRTEMKNLASLKAIKTAVDTEAKRQSALLSQGKTVVQQTRRWDEQKNASFAMRSKEEAHDYQYFPEPDLPPLVITDDDISAVRATLPELPEAKRLRYVEALGLSDYDAAVLCAEPATAALFEETLAMTNNPKMTANWMMGEVMMLQKEGGGTVSPASLGAVINAVMKGEITRESGKEVLAAAYRNGPVPAEYIQAHGLKTVQDSALLLATVRTVLSESEKAVTEYRAGKEKSFNFLLGQCMKRLQGKADAAAIRTILKEELGTQ